MLMTMLRASVLFLVALWPALADAAHIQGVAGQLGSGSTGQTSSPGATGNAIGAGNAVCGIVASVAGSDLTSSVNDDKGNNYPLLDSVHEGSGNGRSFCLFNIMNGPSTLMAHFSSNVTYSQIIWDEYSNASGLDGHTGQGQGNPGNGANAATSGNITTTINGDAIWGGIIVTSDTAPTQGTGFTLRTQNLANYGFTTEDKSQTSAGAVAATFTANGGNTNTATFVAALRPGTPPPSGVSSVTGSGTVVCTPTTGDVQCVGSSVPGPKGDPGPVGPSGAMARGTALTGPNCPYTLPDGTSGNSKDGGSLFDTNGTSPTTSVNINVCDGTLHWFKIGPFPATAR